MKNTDHMYKKGIDTRNKIIQAAKKLFYEHGYNKTTVTMIKKEADVSLSAIPYYFKTKDQIVRIIYNEFLSNIYKFLEEQLDEKVDSYLKQFHASKIYYYIILNNKNNNRFYYEVSVTQSNYKLLFPFMNRVYVNYAKDFNISLSDKELSLIRMADAGARREILYNYYNNLIDLSIDELIDNITALVGILMGIDKSIAEKYGKLSTECAKSLDYSHIKFLI